MAVREGRAFCRICLAQCGTHLTIDEADRIVSIRGDSSITDLVNLSQVVLCLELPFAMFPLLHLTSSRKRMGEFVNRPWLKVLSWSVAALIAGLNAWFLVMMLR